MTTDHNFAINFVRNNPANNIVVCISQNVTNYPQFIQDTGAMIASILTPPYEAFMLEVSGDMNGFCAAYYNHLAKRECTEYIAALLKAITMGKNILLYLTPEEAQTSYSATLRAYMLQTYGICIGDEYMQFTWQINQVLNVALTLYSFDLITYSELFEVWKINPLAILPDPIILKLINEIQPPVPDNYTMTDYLRVFQTMAIGHDGKQLFYPAKVVKK